MHRNAIPYKRKCVQILMIKFDVVFTYPVEIRDHLNGNW